MTKQRFDIGCVSYFIDGSTTMDPGTPHPQAVRLRNVWKMIILAVGSPVEEMTYKYDGPVYNVVINFVDDQTMLLWIGDDDSLRVSFDGKSTIIFNLRLIHNELKIPRMLMRRRRLEKLLYTDGGYARFNVDSKLIHSHDTMSIFPQIRLDTMEVQRVDRSRGLISIRFEMDMVSFARALMMVGRE